MGYYIETGTNTNKAQIICDTHNGQRIRQPKLWSDIPADEALIVIVNNGMFEAAGFAYDEREFEAFTYTVDYRHKEFVLIDRELAEKLTRFGKKYAAKHKIPQGNFHKF
jgi:hypothetical protein